LPWRTPWDRAACPQTGDIVKLLASRDHEMNKIGTRIVTSAFSAEIGAMCAQL
jgi:hypothetical protein